MTQPLNGPSFQYLIWEAGKYEVWCDNLKKNMSSTADILQELFGHDLLLIEDVIDNDDLVDIWIEIESDSVYAVSIEEGFMSDTT